MIDKYMINCTIQDRKINKIIKRNQAYFHN